MDALLNVEDYENAAREGLEPGTFDFFAGGAGDEFTLRANRTAYQHWMFRPRAMAGVADRELSATILGDPFSTPIGIAPSAFQRLAHPDGELAMARAAGAAGTLMCVSTMATTSLEDVAAAASAPVWFQTYIFKDRGLTRDLAARARAAGYRALVLTADTPVLGRRERDLRNRFELPPDAEMQNLPLPPARRGTYESPMMRFSDEQFDPSVSWHDMEVFVDSAPLPVLIKGILHPGDALLASEMGVAGLIVSNHGGRQLDGVLSTLDALPPIVDAVGAGTFEIILDGGVRRGTDVVKALALGAKMVLVGRPVLWGLAVAGEQGVSHVLEILRSELDTALALIGCSNVSDLDPGYLHRVMG